MNRYSNEKNGSMGVGENGSIGGGYRPRPIRDHEPLSKTNVFIRGLATETNDNDLYELCSKFGTILSTKSITDRLTNECKGYGFVNFENPDDATVAVRELTNTGFQARMSKETMGRTERSSFERQSPPEFRRNGGGNPRFNGGSTGGGMRRLSKTNLYLRGLEPTTSDDDLHQLCGRYGNVVSAKAIIDRVTNECKGYGFVNFDSPYSAEQAVADLANRGYQVQMSRENRAPRQPILAGAPAWQ